MWGVKVSKVYWVGYRFSSYIFFVKGDLIKFFIFCVIVFFVLFVKEVERDNILESIFEKNFYGESYYLVVENMLCLS